MKKLCESLREHTMKIVDFEKKKMIPLTSEPQELHEKTKISYICKEKFKHKYTNDKNYRQIKDHCYYTNKHRGAAHTICNLKCSIPKEILVIFQSGSNYYYYFVIILS